jgi:hypothetical protein
MRCLHQITPQQTISGFADPQFRLAVSALPLLGLDSQKRSYVPAVLESLRVFNGQDIGQRDQRPYSVYLRQ